MTARTILIVDDDDAFRATIELSLEMEPDWSVVSETAGERAVPRAAELQPDLILLDVSLAGMDGPTTLATLRRDPRTSALPVIFVAGHMRLNDVARLKGLGAVGVIARPLDPL